MTTPPLAKPVTDFYYLQPDHPANRFDGCRVSSGKTGILDLRFERGGRSVIVLKALAPLEIVKQTGLSARLLPGWDGTLGYSLYALEVESTGAGCGQVELAVVPVPSGEIHDAAAFMARNSRFPDSQAGFSSWQTRWRERLVKRLTGERFPVRIPFSAEVLSSEDHPDFILRRVRYHTQIDRTNTLLVSLPKNQASPAPVLLTLHGHEGTWGEADAAAYRMGHNDDFCAYFAERGWVVVQPATMDHKLQHAAWTLSGEWTWDAMVALDYTLSLPEADGQHVAVCGLSTGAQLAMNMLALDSRVTSGVVGCILSTWHHYRERMRIPPHCDCGTLGQFGGWLEQCDWAALAAPKRVQFHHGLRDVSFCPGADPALLDTAWNTSVMPEEEFTDVMAEVRRAYRLAGGEDPVELHLHGNGHRVDSPRAFDFLTSSGHEPKK